MILVTGEGILYQGIAGLDREGDEAYGAGHDHEVVSREIEREEVVTE